MMLFLLDKIVRLVHFLKRLDERKRAALFTGVTAIFIIPAMVLAMQPGKNPQSPHTDANVQPPKTVQNANVSTESSRQPIAGQTAPAVQDPPGQPGTAAHGANPQSQNADTGDLHKQHPAPGAPNLPPSTGQLSISQSSLTIHAGETIDNAFVATVASGETISPVSIDHSESTPAVEGILSVSPNDGFPIPMYKAARNVNITASAGATPGTYSIVVKANTDPYMDDNVNFYAATLTVTILPETAH